MKHRWILYLFGINLLAELVAIDFGLMNLSYFTKPLLMILLGLFVLLQPAITKKIRKFLLPAIIFSLAGDIFLLFDDESNLNFIFGLISFLSAHLFYILLFLSIRRHQAKQQSWNPWIIASLLLYVLVLFYILNPYLGDLKIPVIVYALVLNTMLIAAIHAFKFSNADGRLVITGACLFVASDSLLAINKFYAPFAFSGTAIMLTYALAQVLIVIGVTKFTGSADKP